MFLRKMKDPTTLIRTGSLFLVLASLWKWLVHPTAHLSGDVVDGVTGFLYGISIASYLLGLRLRSKRGGTHA